ncbi:hypothetical protein RCL1_001126 [Eukaryota sp. TZLM3-RCL]
MFDTDSIFASPQPLLQVALDGTLITASTSGLASLKSCISCVLSTTPILPELFAQSITNQDFHAFLHGESFILKAVCRVADSSVFMTLSTVLRSGDDILISIEVEKTTKPHLVSSDGTQLSFSDFPQLTEVALDLTESGVWVLTADDRLFWSSGTFTLMEASSDDLHEITFENIDDKWLEPFRSDIRQKLDAVRKSGGFFRYRAPIRTLKGNIRWFDITALSENTSDVPANVFGVVTDVTADVMAQQSAEEIVKNQNLLLEQLRDTDTELRRKLQQKIYVQKIARVGFFVYNTKTTTFHFDEMAMAIHGLNTPSVSLEVLANKMIDRQKNEFIDTIAACGTMASSFYIEEKRMTFEEPPSTIIVAKRGKVVERDDEGNVLTIEGTVQDITDYYQARETAIALAKSKSLFLGTVSHELRSPLQSLIGMLTIIREGLDSDKDMVQVASLAYTSAVHLLSLINNVVDISRVEHGKVALEYSDVVLTSVIDECLKIVDTQIELPAKFEVVSFVDPAADVVVRCDRSRLIQIISNLLTIAVKCTTQGVIKLDLSLNEQRADKVVIRVAVIDSGYVRRDDITLLETAATDPFELIQHFSETKLNLAVSASLLLMMSSRLFAKDLANANKFWFDLELLCLKTSSTLDIPQTIAFILWKACYSQKALIDQLKALNCIVQEIDAFKVEELNEAAFHQSELPKIMFVHSQFMQYPAVSQVLSSCSSTVVLISNTDLKYAGTVPLKMPILFHELVLILKKTITGETIEEKRKVRSPANGTKFSVLFADDLEVNRKVISTLLKSLGLDVSLAEDGREAVDLFKRNPFGYDLIILDFRMPTPGTVAAKEIREFEASHGLPSISLITLTADASLESKTESYEAGINTWLSKPVSKQTLEQTLEKYLPFFTRTQPIQYR